MLIPKWNKTNVVTTQEIRKWICINQNVTGTHKKWRYPSCVTKHRLMQMYWGVEVYLHAFFSLAVDWGGYLSLHPCQFTHRKELPHPLIWALSRSEKLCPTGNWIPVAQPITYSLHWTSYSRTLDQKSFFQNELQLSFFWTLSAYNALTSCRSICQAVVRRHSEPIPALGYVS
jgi:hypothetical protein